MKSKILNTTNLVIFFACLFIVSACAPAPLKTSPIVSLDTANKTKIPLRVGYYVPQDYCTWIWRAPLPHTYSYFLGDTICGGVETMLVTSFEDMVRLNSADDDFTSQNIEALVIPEMLQIDINTNRNTVFIKMKWSIRDSNKNILWADTITGTAHEICMAKWCRKKIVEAAFQEQFQKALESVLKQDWWQSIKNK